MKRPRENKWIKKKKDPSVCCLQVTHFRSKNAHKLKVKGWKKIFHANGNEKKADMILISQKVNFKIKMIIKDKDIT